jgi:flagellar FliJ protein
MLQRELAKANQELSDHERILNNLYSQKSESFHFANTALMGSFAEEFRQLQDIRIEKQKEAVKQAHSQVENVRIRLIQKDRDLKMMEKIKEKRAAEYYLGQEKLEQLHADDLSTSKVARRKK